MEHVECRRYIMHKQLSTWSELMRAMDLDVGQMAVVDDKNSDCDGHVVMRNYSNVVDLNNPLNTWSGYGGLWCRPFRPGSAITLVTK